MKPSEAIDDGHLSRYEIALKAARSGLLREVCPAGHSIKISVDVDSQVGHSEILPSRDVVLKCLTGEECYHPVILDKSYLYVIHETGVLVVQI